MAVQDTTIQANVNNYFFKTRADYEAHASEILNNSTIYIESDGEYGNVKMNVLWENSNPSTAFSAQTLNNLGLSDYDFIGIEFKTYYGTISSYLQYFKNIVLSRNFINITYYANGVNTTIRGFTINQTSIVFEDCYSNGNSSNDNGIPVRIYGIKIIPVSDSSGGGGSQVSVVDWSLGGNA